MSRVLPILFNTKMVRAILDGRKTVTRRVIKEEQYMPVLASPARKRNPEIPDKYFIERLARTPCEVGNILYARETWCNTNRDGIEPDYYYLADVCICEDYNKAEWNWHPSIHMPKEAARIWLRVTSVRMERLQEITEEQAIKEGITAVRYDMSTGEEESAGLCWFPVLWDSTIKKADISKYGWNANPWVWVIEFERCGKPERT